ncbi:MAG TPA: hypothetical protein VGI67_03775 [Thermoleophilaceae bacterium]
MARKDPRREIARRREARNRVRIVHEPESESAAGGPVTSRQSADVTLPRSELDPLWTPEHLEMLASTYWRFLTRVSLGVLRVVYTPTSRAVVVFGRPLTLLRFDAPEYETSADCGIVTWRIDRGLLVAPAGRGKGWLRITVRRPSESLLPDDPTTTADDHTTVRVTSEVASFYPMLAGWGWFWKIGRHIYRATQLRIHVIVTTAFLRSLARLDLAPSVVGALRAPEQEAVTSDQ